ncbi:MAG: hypothetical protein IIV71_04745 [Bacteroidaceae bacterium]|nr:hypothetical protein [Bacteroidaceae bacterium]
MERKADSMPMKPNILHIISRDMSMQSSLGMLNNTMKSKDFRDLLLHAQISGKKISDYLTTYLILQLLSCLSVCLPDTGFDFWGLGSLI